MEPAEQKGNDVRKEVPGATSLRTYQGDLARVITTDQTSVAKIAIAENERRIKTIPALAPEPPRSRRSRTILSWGAGAAGLVLLGIGGSFLASNVNRGANGGPAAGTGTPAGTTLISADKVIPIAVGSRSGGSLISALAKERDSERLPFSSVAVFSFSKEEGDAPAVLSAEDFFSLLGVSVPADLSRTLDAPFVSGLYSLAPNQFFLILKTNYYQSALAGMLEWEKTMDADIGLLFHEPESGNGGLFSPKPAWSDEVIHNRDSRVLRDTNGATLFLYSFLDSSTIAIAANEAAIAALSRRVLSGGGQ